MPQLMAGQDREGESTTPVALFFPSLEPLLKSSSGTGFHSVVGPVMGDRFFL